MGYTTEFAGAVKLGRKLTLAEAKVLLEISESDDAQAITGIDAYFQWVPAETLEHIVWDGNEKFYHYEEQLRWLSNWLSQRGILANGHLYWKGETDDDTGVLIVSANCVTAKPTARSEGPDPKPLTLCRLGRMALDQATA